MQYMHSTDINVSALESNPFECQFLKKKKHVNKE